MELRVYFQKIRDVEATIAQTYTHVMSVATGDGGKAGVISEVSRRVAAKMLVEGSAILATAEQIAAFHERIAAAKLAAQEAAAAARVEFTMVTSEGLKKLRGGSSFTKG